MACAQTSLPVPVSPTISTLASQPASSGSRVATAAQILTNG